MSLFLSSQKRLDRLYSPIIRSINEIEPEFQRLSNNELKKQTKKLKKEVLATKFLSKKLIIESFALIREASKRTLNLRHYESQLLGGLILNDGKIAEMKTGEGKTLVATSPAFVNALSGKGVQIVTVNNYLTRRDAEWMGQIYRLLGLKVGLIQDGMETILRKKNYLRDVTYITNSELGFDFLRDNLASTPNSLVQRPRNFCIIDEVDSILIDEARTPLIIAGKSEIAWAKVYKAKEVIKNLKQELHFYIEEKSKTISFTEQGIKKIQNLLNIPDVYDVNNPWLPYVLNAAKAKFLYFSNTDYIVKNNEVEIVDQFTGRILESRKWGDGLHEAIEAKENIFSLEGSDTLSSITYQSFFRMYPKMAGMTGTAITEKLEFETVYNLLVSEIPTFKPIIRKDFPDTIFIDETSKWRAVAYECLKKYKEGQPVLVGTTTIQNSETLSSLLKDYNIPCQLLNAKPENVKQETEIIAQAGCYKTITIATNMAGRGTDILLGGNPEFQARRQTYEVLSELVQTKEVSAIILENRKVLDTVKEIKKNLSLISYLKEKKKIDTLLNIVTIPNKNLNSFEKLIAKLFSYFLEINKKKCSIEKTKVNNIGGLYVIGTERHESRRIDNQLRGRAGRQGDPGSSRFFLSLTDPLLKQFGGNTIKNLVKFLDLSNQAIESKSFSATLDSAQKKIEGYHYSQRDYLNKYDKILHFQRNLVYQFRYEILSNFDFRAFILEFGESFIDEILRSFKNLENQNLKNKRFLNLFYNINISLEEINFKDKENLLQLFYRQLWATYEKVELEFSCYDSNLLAYYQKTLFLKYLDIYWSKHLENMNFLKETVSWQAYAQKDPFLKYEKESYVLLQLTFKNCRDSIVTDFLGLDFF